MAKSHRRMREYERMVFDGIPERFRVPPDISEYRKKNEEHLATIKFDFKTGKETIIYHKPKKKL